MPALAVIPAPIAYIKVVAVKKLLVELKVNDSSGEPNKVHHSAIPDVWIVILHLIGWGIRFRLFTLKKLECLKQAFRLNMLAWDNEI